MKIPYRDVSRICVGFTFPVVLTEILQGNYGFFAVFALALAFMLRDLHEMEQETLRGRVEP